jgi:hypothetical protein
MSLSKTCVLWIAVCCLSGCAYSIYPVATQDILVDTPDLSGTWKRDDSHKGMAVEQMSLVMKKAGKEHPGLYRVELTQEKGVPPSVWDAQLLKLGDVLYLEISPINSQMSPMQAQFNIPLHKLFRIVAAKDEFRVDVCNDGKLIPAAKKAQIGAFKSGPERLVITASSRELQEFYREHGAQFFDEKQSVRFRREKTDK